MSTEHVVWEGAASAPLILDVTCSKCFRIWRYHVTVVTVVAQLLADEGWSFPDEAAQVCAKCQP